MSRPLSSWVATVGAQPDVRWDPRQSPNDGLERRDARTLDRFVGRRWSRELVTLPADAGESVDVLGLVRDDTGETVIELDDYCRPIPVTPRMVDVIRRFEESWPDVSADDDDLRALSGAPLALRHSLLDRLAAETAPPTNLFAILPWSDFDQFAEELADALRGTGQPSARSLHHWFSPVGGRLTAALEQINAGLAAGDAAVVRRGATALCARAISVELARIPAIPRTRLAEIALLLAGRDRFLTHAARRLAARLREESPIDVGVVLSTRFELAASGSEEDRPSSAVIDADPIRIDLRVSAGGFLTIGVRAAGVAAGGPEVETYGTVVVPVLLSWPGGTRRYYVPLSRRVDGLGGRLEVSPPAVRFEATADAPPIGNAEVAALDPPELASSLVNLDGGARNAWRDIGSSLPPSHPLAPRLRTSGSSDGDL